MEKNITETVAFKSEEIKRENIRHLLRLVNDALNEKGYNSVSQLAGYIVSNDPAYISTNNNARSLIQGVERYDIIEELVRYYLEGK